MDDDTAKKNADAAMKHLDSMLVPGVVMENKDKMELLHDSSRDRVVGREIEELEIDSFQARERIEKSVRDHLKDAPSGDDTDRIVQQYTDNIYDQHFRGDFEAPDPYDR